jgi:hypothetical protein
VSVSSVLCSLLTGCTAKFIQKLFLERSEAQQRYNCARMHGFGFALCAVDAICAAHNLRCHQAWAQNAPLALHRSKLFRRRP